MKVGDSAEVTRRFSADDLRRFEALGGGRAGRVVPEPLIGALWSFLLGVRLPGIGTNYLRQETRHHAPADLDEPLTARVRITGLRLEKHLVDLETTCQDAAGRLIASGRALVYVRDLVGPRES